jgi:hypothetical protein
MYSQQRPSLQEVNQNHNNKNVEPTSQGSIDTIPDHQQEASEWPRGY